MNKDLENKLREIARKIETVVPYAELTEEERKLMKTHDREINEILEGKR